MRSKVLFGHPKWAPAAILPKINKKIKFRMDLKWPEMPSKVDFGHPKWPIKLKWPVMRSKVICGHPKWPPKKKMSRSELARFAIESEFRTSKMADASHFIKNLKQKLKLRIDLKWPEMQSKVN